MNPFIPVHGAPLQVRMPIVTTSSPNTYMVMGVRDEWIGAIVGRGGKTISDIQQVEFTTISASLSSLLCIYIFPYHVDPYHPCALCIFIMYTLYASL